MKILVLNHSDSPWHLQGAQISLIEFITQWQSFNTDLEPIFVSASKEDGVFFSLCREKGWEVLRINLDWWLETEGERTPSFRSSQFLSDLSSMSQLRSLIRDTKPALTLTNTITIPWLAYAASAENVPHIWYCHEFGDIGPGLRYRYGFDETYKLIGQLSEFVIANSLSTKNFLAKHIDHDKIKIKLPLRSGEEISALSEMISSLAIPPKSNTTGLRVGFIGGRERNKNVTLLLSAFEQLQDSENQFELINIGTTEQHEASVALKSYNPKQQNLQIHNIGPVNNPLPIISSCDVLVSTSLNESFGMAIFESQFLGIPVISVPHQGAHEQIVNDSTGTILENYSSSELADALVSYATDKEKITSYGLAAKNKTREVMKQSLENDNLLFSQLNVVASGMVHMRPDFALKSLLDQAQEALGSRKLVQLSSLMGTIKVRSKLSISFMFRALKFKLKNKGR